MESQHVMQIIYLCNLSRKIHVTTILKLFNLIEILLDDRKRIFAISDFFLLETHILEENCMLETDFKAGL